MLTSDGVNEFLAEGRIIAGKSKFAPTCDPKPGGGAEADLVGADAAANPGGGGLENPGGGGFAGC